MKLLLACLMVLILAPSLDPAGLPEDIPRLAPKIVSYAHAYHGIKVSMQSVAYGNRFFKRNGKICKLFTKGFLEWYPKEKERRQQKHLTLELKRTGRLSKWRKD